MNGKFYILNQPFCLRGYDKLPYALLHRPDNSIQFVKKDTFWALSLCDGKTDCSLPIFPENVRNIVQELVKNGIARECEYGAELTADQQYNKIYIARTDALNDESVFQRLYDSASPYRRRKTHRLIFRKDKMLSLASEELLRIALADNGITDFSVVYGENGKPYLRNNELYFSLSHSEETVMCAVSESEIGADTEKVTEIDLDIAKHYFYPDEYEMLAKIETDAERRDMFFRLWTLKESYAKALGVGILLPFDSFCIDIKNGNITVRQNANNGRFFFKEYELNDGYKYSACGLFPQFEENVAVVSLK